MATKDTWSAQDYNGAVPYVYSPKNTMQILQLLNAQPGERILDFGCGSGEVTLELQRLVGINGVVIGVDSSQSMIQKARENGVKHAVVADVQDLFRLEDMNILLAQMEGSFDAVFSNAALHWCKRSPEGVLESARRMLKPGGRFVIEMGGFMNCVGIRSVLHRVMLNRGYDPVERDPWFFPSMEEYQTLLEKHHFRVSHISLTPRITPMQGDMTGWLRVFCKEKIFDGMGDDETNQIIKEVNAYCAMDHRDSEGRWSVMYVRLRVVAIHE